MSGGSGTRLSAAQLEAIATSVERFLAPNSRAALLLAEVRAQASEIARLHTALTDLYEMTTETELHRREGDLDEADRDPDMPENVCCECEDRWPCYVERARRLVAESVPTPPPGDAK